MWFLTLLSAVLVIASIPATGLTGVLLAVAGVACAIPVLRHARKGGGRR